MQTGKQFLFFLKSWNLSWNKITADPQEATGTATD